MRKVILYLAGDKLFGEWPEMDGARRNLALVSFGDQCEGRALQIGGIDLGLVTGFRVTPSAVGLVVEWESWIEQGQIIDTGV